MLKVQSSRSLLRFIQSLNCNPQTKTGNQLSKLHTLHLHVVKVIFRSPMAFSFIDCNVILFLWLFQLLVPCFLVRYSVVLSSPTCWSFQCNLGFTFRASHNGLSGPPCRDAPEALLGLAALLSSGGRFHNPFNPTSFMILKPGHMADAAISSCPLWMEPDSLLEFVLHFAFLLFLGPGNL